MQVLTPRGEEQTPRVQNSWFFVGNLNESEEEDEEEDDGDGEEEGEKEEEEEDMEADSEKEEEARLTALEERRLEGKTEAQLTAPEERKLEGKMEARLTAAEEQRLEGKVPGCGSGSQPGKRPHAHPQPSWCQKGGSQRGLEMECGVSLSPAASSLCPQKPRVMAGTVKLEDKQRLAQEEESEAKRLAIMMMKKREKYLYNKIMFGKKRKIREVSLPAPPRQPEAPDGASQMSFQACWLSWADSGPKKKILREYCVHQNLNGWEGGSHLIAFTVVCSNSPPVSFCACTNGCYLGGIMPYLLEEGMATHSSDLAWRIPWTEEPSGLQSMESLRVGHD